MKTLPTPFSSRINDRNVATSWIWLYEIDVDDATTLRYAAYPIDVTFNSLVYSHFPIRRAEIQEDSKGGLPSVTVSVSAVDRSIVAYLEQNDALLGRKVRVLLVHEDHLGDPTYKLQTTFEVIDASVDDTWATFTLGHYDLERLRFPTERYVRDACRWRYRGVECGYLNSDEFDWRTRQENLLTGGDAAKGFRWTAVNTAAASAADVDATNPGALTVNLTATATAFDGATRSGFALYKAMADGPNFDVEGLTAGNGDAADEAEGLLVWSGTDLDDWLFAGRGWTGAAMGLLIRDTTNGVTVETVVATTDRYVRITRVTNLFTVYTKATAGAAWTQRHQTTRADLPTNPRLGVACWPGNVADNFVARIEHFRINSGGLATCQKDETDCALHNNTARFGGFPGIPYGPIEF